MINGMMVVPEIVRLTLIAFPPFFRATGGELQAILDDEGELSEPQAQICMREILQALRYLHSKSIAHLDLKPQNILMCGEKVEGGCLWLINYLLLNVLI